MCHKGGGAGSSPRLMGEKFFEFLSDQNDQIDWVSSCVDQRGSSSLPIFVF